MDQDQDLNAPKQVPAIRYLDTIRGAQGQLTSYLSVRGYSERLEKTSMRLSLAWRAKLRPETMAHGTMGMG